MNFLANPIILRDTAQRLDLVGHGLKSTVVYLKVVPKSPGFILPALLAQLRQNG